MATTELELRDAPAEVFLTPREETVIHHAIEYIDSVTLGHRSPCHTTGDALEDLRKSVLDLKRARRRAREAEKGGE